MKKRLLLFTLITSIFIITGCEEKKNETASNENTLTTIKEKENTTTTEKITTNQTTQKTDKKVTTKTTTTSNITTAKQTTKITGSATYESIIENILVSLNKEKSTNNLKYGTYFKTNINNSSEISKQVNSLKKIILNFSFILS